VTHAISSSHPFQCSLVLRSKTGAKVPHFLIPTKYFFIFFAFFHNHRCESAVCRRKNFSVQAKNGPQISAMHTSAALFPGPAGGKRTRKQTKPKYRIANQRLVKITGIAQPGKDSSATRWYTAISPSAVMPLSGRCPVVVQCLTEQRLNNN
jgi:hypothetical protein